MNNLRLGFTETTLLFFITWTKQNKLTNFTKIANVV